MTEKINITGITHANSKYIKNLDQIMSHLRSSLSQAGFECDQNIKSWQPENSNMNYPGKFKSHFIWLISYWSFFSASQKKSPKTRATIFTILYMYRRILGKKTEVHSRNNPRYMYLDFVLTGKHLEAYADFLESDKDLLLVVCDDVVRSELEDINPTELITIIDENKNGDGLFLELAPFYSVSQLKREFNYDVISNGPGYWLKMDFFCNTGAMYIVNRRAASLLLQEVLERPYYRWISIDWMLTKAFRNTGKKTATHYWTTFPQSYLNSSLYTGEGELVGKDGDAKVMTQD